MSKPLSYYVDLVKNSNTDNLPERLKRYREAYEYQNTAKNVEANTGGTQSGTPLLPIRQQVALPGPTNNQLSNAILMPNNVQVKANQAMIQQGLQPAYLGQAPTVTQPQPLPDPSTLHRVGSGTTGVIKSMAATIPMFVDTAAQTFENKNKDSQNHFYTEAYKEYQNLYNQVEAYKKQHPDSVKAIAKLDPTDPRGVRKITVTEYSPELQALLNAMKEKEDFMNLQKDTTPVSSDSLGMEMYRDANKDKEYALQGLDATGRFLGSTLMSIGQNALTLPFATVNPALSLGMMSANAASDRMGELNEQRVSAGESLGRGLLSGGIEAATEKVSLESLLNIADTAPKSIKEALINTGKQMVAEGSEEGVSYLLNSVADHAAKDPEAEMSFLGLGESMLGGALSGGLMGGGANLVGYAKGSNNVSFKDSKQAVTLPLGQQITNNENIEFSNAVEQSVNKITDNNMRENAKKVLNVLKDKIFKNGQLLSFKEQLVNENSVNLTTQPYLVKESLSNMPVQELNNKPVVISQKNVDKSLNKHKIPLDILGELDVLLQDPVAIIPSFTQNIDGQYMDAYMVYTDLKDHRNQIIQAVIYPNSKFGVEELVVDSIGSVYGRNLENDIKKSQQLGREVWIKKEGIQPSIGLQLPKDVMDTSTYNIPNDNTDVKSNLKNAKTKQLQDSERRSLTQLSKNLQDTFGISRSDVNNELKNEILKLKESIQSTSKIDSKAADALFDKAWDLGQTKDSTMFDLYPELITNIKEAGLDIDLAKKALGKTAYNDYRYEAKKLVGMQKDGRSIDSFYNELANTYPELFDETINNEADQLYAILDVADELQPRNKSLKDTDANLYKDGYREDFHKALNGYLSKMERFQQIHIENLAKNTQKEPVSYEVYKATMDQMKNLERDYERVMREPFTQKEKAYAEDILKGKLDYTDIKNANVDNVRKIVEAKQPLEQASKIKQDYKKAIRQERINTMRELIKSMAMWKEKKFGYAYSMETAERNIIDVVGNNDEANAINETLFEPIHIAEAARNKFMNEYRKRIANLNLTQKESEVVQRYGEGDMKAEDVVNDGFDLERIQHAVNEFRAVYDELLSKMNEVLVKNGYNPIEARKDYFPHFLEQENNGILEKIKRLFDPNNNTDNLGTSLAGITEFLRPGKQFFANTLERHTDKTVFDAVRGFDNYIDGVSNVIFHTDNIQNLRAFEETIRYQNSDDGLKTRIDEINNDGDLSEDERQSRISQLFRDREKTTKFGDFVSWLNRYTNDLAGKKSVEDRTWEYNLGRGMYSLSKDLSNRVAGNMVAVNPSSWVTNIIPIVQATGECSPQNITKAMYGVVNKNVVNDDFNSRSTFMTNRLGSENLYKTDMQKIVDKLSKGMQIIDNFTSEVVTRAKYYQNIENGMSDADAMKNADAYAAGLIADRSKGAMPTLFNIKNPITKAFTQFQLEQNNQLRYLFKDLPRAKQDEAMKALLIALFNIATSSWLFNNVYEAFFGRRPALDPIDMAFDAWGVLNDPDLKNSEKATTILSDVGGELPFVGNLTGGGRLPIAGAFPKWSELPKVLDLMDPEIDDRKKQDVLYKTIIKPASYWMLPFGAGQLNKTMSGLHDYAQGASYQYTDDGDKLKYTIDQNPFNLARAFIGGSSSFPEARNYWEGDYKTLSVKDTDTYQMLKDDLGNKTALEKVYELKAIESLKNANGGTIKYSKAILTRDYIDGLPLSDEEKQDLYKKYIVSENIRDADSAAYKIYKEKFEKELQDKK